MLIIDTQTFLKCFLKIKIFLKENYNVSTSKQKQHKAKSNKQIIKLKRKKWKKQEDGSFLIVVKKPKKYISVIYLIGFA